MIDDGIATGATMRSALQWVSAANPAFVIVAVPVAPEEVIAAIEQDCDAVICLDTPAPFHSVGLHYRRFDQVSDETELPNGKVFRLNEDFSLDTRVII